ncbi:tRNA (N6-isopentenyl adenosine(37)-C2)-methylthiotransferase MiaB [Sinimarinibacterium sp. CAU 1509]|uniref:tRNA (N6-isopentenyl adenosine(37)-C2)-methylthiotransferase MiaB n=1 Tax=Sinimarinibacterium sp. CAU 1509 TaxID=2562283 RepID=UPI0010AD172B|nr:tRNA (N6-isopentenyl adenosine(37)-C2)-methylthiotransferase MiaB [Sinimarinibacterium sp. CAU 1509]TJY56770.1 tRNA (N6-isopentenyl adenosine(37)-C2)-methylthiotransferase MiaB [Sinimarinibacterium sp. CAU 1509]
MSKKLYLITYGCQMNEYDSSKMADVLAASHGYERTQNPDEADLLLLNTCSVREKAQEKVFSELGRWKEWKSADPDRIIGVGGCVASQEGQAIIERAPYVDLVFGPQTLHRLPELLTSTRQTRKHAVDISFPEIEKFDRLPEPRAEGCTAFVSIMEGCSKYCTFCVVPYTRGEEVSRPLDDVLTEVAQLAAQGVREITLLGQNVNAYRGRMGETAERCDLALLITYIARIPGIDRIRYTTSHPAEFTDALIDAFADEPKLASYLHLPVQAGSDRILGMMKRGYTRAQYLDKIRRIRAARPDLSLSTDFIIGFPTESEDDFIQTMDLIAEAGIDGAYSFIYSPRPGTPASNLRDGVPLEEKQRRLSILQDRIRAQDEAFKRGMLGTRQRVLVERAARKGEGFIAGRTSTNRMVNFEGPQSLIGRFVDVTVTEATPNALRGRLLDAGAVA